MTDLSQYIAGKNSEARRATRRKTLASITVLKGPEFEDGASVTNLSEEGCFVTTSLKVPKETGFEFQIELPTNKGKPIQVGGKVVRLAENGLGILFVEVNTRDRSRLREYSRFAEMDDMVVRVQRRVDHLHLLSGNLLPVSDREAIEQRLHLAADRRLKALVVDPERNSEPIWASIGLDGKGLRLHDLERPISEGVPLVYIVVFDGPLHFMFEGLLAERGLNPLVLEPERMYHNERRSGFRRPVMNAWMEFEVQQMDEGLLRLPLVDISERGCAVKTARSSLIIPGMQLPPFQIQLPGSSLSHSGATVRRLAPSDSESWLVGLNFSEGVPERDVFSEIRTRQVKKSFFLNLSRYGSLAKQKLRGLVKPKAVQTREGLHIARYKNADDENVCGLLDATFDLDTEPPNVDVAVVVAPAFLRRKEVFCLLARTLVDNFKAQKLNAVVLRFDATHTVGESHIDPEMEAQGTPYLKWTFTQLEKDIKASLLHLERRFRPKKRVLVTFSVAAMSARRYIADGNKPAIDHWIAPFGCPDAQDMFQNYLAGIDLFQNYLRGDSAEPFLIYGRLADPNYVFKDAMKRGMAFLEQARADMAKITCPVTWIVGTYDYMVTRERVRQLINSPGGGLRKTYEMASGHVVKTGDEAIESFKLVTESIFQHVFNLPEEAIEPDMGRYMEQNSAEWARTRQSGLADAKAFWTRHLFGTGDGNEGYDVLLHNPDYVEFLKEEVSLLDPQPGEQIADIGCGTGNLSLMLMDHPALKRQNFHLSCLDLVPEAVELTKAKLSRKLSDLGEQGPRPNLKSGTLDLEAARFMVLKEFLEGQLYGIGGLNGRIEGLYVGTLKKMEKYYGPPMHRIVRGAVANAQEVAALNPELDEDEIESVLELSRASRFLYNKLAADDLLTEDADGKDVSKLAFRRLNFTPGNRECRINVPTETFDRIGSSLVISYIYDPLSVLKEYYRALKPGGTLVVSGLKPNFDSSKSYLDEAKTIATSNELGEAEQTRLLTSLREFASFVGCVMELEDEGRFRFFSGKELADLVAEAHFENIELLESFGKPATAVIARARKPK